MLHSTKLQILFCPDGSGLRVEVTQHSSADSFLPYWRLVACDPVLLGISDSTQPGLSLRCPFRFRVPSGVQLSCELTVILPWVQRFAPRCNDLSVSSASATGTYTPQLEVRVGVELCFLD
jgi:hypothetical protein